mgnify:CR=1 FL=1
MGGVNHAYTNQTATSPTVIFLTSTSLTSWTVPNDFNISANTIELIGAGGGGQGGGATKKAAQAGGGGGYVRLQNVSTLVPGTTYTIQIGTGGTGGAAGTASVQYSGTTGGQTVLNTNVSTIAASGGGGGGLGGQGGIGSIPPGSPESVNGITFTGGSSGTTTSSTTSTGGAGGGGADHPHVDGAGQSPRLRRTQCRRSRGGDPRQAFGEAGLNRALDSGLFGDGGVIARSPAVQLDAVMLLTMMREVYDARGLVFPEHFQARLQKMISALYLNLATNSPALFFSITNLCAIMLSCWLRYRNRSGA